MSTMSMFRSAAHASAGYSVFGPVLAFVRRLAAARRGRHALADLCECDDHLLADLGLSRADLTDAFERPAAGDPSARLALIVAARRR